MKSRPFKVGVTIHPQQCTIQELRDAWRRADDLGVDSIWFWDHFFPLYGNPNGNHFECWSILAAAAIDTRAPQIGPMVTCAGYRNPDVLASIAATVDQLSGGRLVLGLGAGWFARDYAEYGFDFGEARDRVRLLKEVLPRIKQRIKKLRPGPAGPMPLLIAGGGEQVMLRLVAEHAQMWNSIASTGEFARKSALLDDYCRRIGRDPAEIERTANVGGLTPKVIDEWLKAGLQHFVLRMAHPFETKDVERLLKVRDS
ncbi:MAG: LLM class F420-dependent oxidoreductase [Chloroflexi bacterium]|nr:MAG: LLM class F420-dependent oxidoreductase [Chloroflexota bacterium]TME38824.1 MAG: LLM class F420-dependent oxidoreductase [Chloroflexota bacterium]